MYIPLSLSHASGVTIKKGFPQWYWQIVPTVVTKHIFPLVYFRARCHFVVSFKLPADRAHRKKWHVLLGEMPDNVVTKKSVTTHDDVESDVREGNDNPVVLSHYIRLRASHASTYIRTSSVIIHVFRYSIFRPVYEQSQLRDRRNTIIKVATAYLISWRKRKPLLATGGESSRIRE